MYVEKSVASVLRNAGNWHPEFVLRIYGGWARKKCSHGLDYQRWFKETQSKISREGGRDNCFVRSTRRITSHSTRRPFSKSLINVESGRGLIQASGFRT
jgi:hypothetical protein